MRTLMTPLFLLFLLLPATFADTFIGVKVRVGRKTCRCALSINPRGTIKNSFGSCNKNCSGFAKGVELAASSGVLVCRFKVRKGRVVFKSVTMKALPTPVTTPTPDTTPTSRSLSLSCPSGFRRVCSMLGSCTLGSFPVCPAGHEESGEAIEPSPSHCRCLPFFLVERLCDPLTGTGVAERTGELATLLPSSTGCLCVTKGPFTPAQFTFNETGQTFVQEQIFFEETGILEVHVPPHNNYTSSVYLVSEEGVLLHTNSSCQLTEAAQNVTQGVLGLPLPENVTGDTYHIVKARQTRVTAQQRENLLSEQQTECRGQSITKTQDLPVSDEDYQKLLDGGIVQVRKPSDTRTRSARAAQGCIEAYACTSEGPHACGYTGWINPSAPPCCHMVPIPRSCSSAPLPACGFTFHQVSTSTICVTCKLKVFGPMDFCNQDRCWCDDITNKEKLMDCAFILDPVVAIAIRDPRRRTKRDSTGTVFAQTMTYSGQKYDAKSLKIEVPQHHGGETTYGQLTVVMHAASYGYWHARRLKDNMLFKRGGRCLITTIPSGFYPVDGALGMKEIVDVLEKEDFRVQHSVILDEGEMSSGEVSNLHPHIKDECYEDSSPRRFKEKKVTSEQAQTLQDGGVVFLPEASTGCYIVKTAMVFDSSGANSWYWPSPSNEKDVAVHHVIHGVEQLSCCATSPGDPEPCCTAQHADLCLCEDIKNSKDFRKCLERPEDDSEVLLVATGSTSATEFTSKHVQYYEKDVKTGEYLFKESGVCNPTGLPQASTLNIGAVVTNLKDETVVLCEGYTGPGNATRQCYRFRDGEGFTVWRTKDGENPLGTVNKYLENGGHSAMIKFEGNEEKSSPEAWFIFPNSRGGTSQGYYIFLDEVEDPMPLLPQSIPEPITVTCVLATDFGIFVSGIPTSSASKGNKNWLYTAQDRDQRSWRPLPETLERRHGGSCGVLRTWSSVEGTANSTVIVMAGGLRSSSSEYLRLPGALLEPPENNPTWTKGPDIGEARYGSRIVSMKTENEVVLVGGISQTTGEVFTQFKVLNASLDIWRDGGDLHFPVFETVALPVPKRILKSCRLAPSSVPVPVYVV